MTVGTVAGHPPQQLDPENPWPGLDSFQEEAQDYFHGRDAEADALLRRVIDAPLTVLFGKSGLGKTSLLRAGLFPRLRQRHYLPVHVRLDIRPGAGALIDQIRDALRAAIVEQQVDAHPALDDRNLWEFLHDASLEMWSPLNYPLTPVLVIDQFEEVFTLGERAAEAVERFQNDLGDLVENRIPAGVAARVAADAARSPLDLRTMPYKVVLTLREDFLPHLEGWRAVMPSLGRVRLRLLPMRPEQALSAVYDTAPHLMDEPLARRIVAFVAAAQATRAADRGSDGEAASGGEIEPALLSLFCRGLNERRKHEGKARFDGQLLEGAQHGIIADYYRSSVETFPEAVSRFIEHELITAKGFRNSYAKEDAVPHYLSEEQLQTLIDRRLLRVEERYGTERIELTHDVLTPAVLEHRNQRKAEDERAALAREEAAKREALEAQARQQRQRLRLMALVAAACLALAGIAGWQWLLAARARAVAEDAQARARGQEAIAIQEREKAENEQKTADEQRVIAEQQKIAAETSAQEAEDARAIAEQQARMSSAREIAATAGRLTTETGTGEDAILLGLQAVMTTYGADRTVTLEAEDSLRRALGGAVRNLAMSGHDRPVDAITFTPDSANVATCGADGTLRVWSTTTGDELRAVETASCVRLVAGPDGMQLVEAQFDGLAINVREVGQNVPLLDINRGRGEQVRTFALSADGRRFAANSGNFSAQRVIIWELKRGQPSSELATIGNDVSGIALNADGHRIAYLESGMAHVVDLPGTTPVPVRSYEVPDGERIAISGDGRILVVVDKTGNVQVWNLTTGQPTSKFGPLQDNEIILSGDGRYLAAANDKTVTIWDTAGSRQIRAADGHAPVAFSPDGERIAFGSGDTAIEIQAVTSDTSVARLYGRRESALAAATLSRDAQFLATSSNDRRIRLWDLASGRPTLTEHEDIPLDVLAVSPSGRWLATSTKDQRLTLWDAAGPAPRRPRALSGQSGQTLVFEMQFLAGGARLVTAGNVNDSPMTLWDIASGSSEPIELVSRAGLSRTFAIGFSRDEQYVALATNRNTAVVHVSSKSQVLEVPGLWLDAALSGSAEWLVVFDQRRAQVWNVRAKQMVRELGADSPSTTTMPRRRHMALSDDGRILAFVDNDGETVSLFDAQTGARRTTLHGRGAKVHSIAIMPDGKTVRVLAEDWTIHDHPIAIPDLLALARSRVKRPLTPEECQKYLGRPCSPSE